MRWRAAATATVLAAVLTTSCSAAPATGPSSAPTEDISREIFRTLPDLAAQLKLDRGTVVVGTALSSVEGPAAAGGGAVIGKGDSGYVAATDTAFQVDQVLAGSGATGTITVHQYGAPDQQYPEFPKVQPGQRYLLVLRDFRWAELDPANMFVVVGYNAVWQVGADGTVTWVRPESNPGISYPNFATVESAGVAFTI